MEITIVPALRSAGETDMLVWFLADSDRKAAVAEMASEFGAGIERVIADLDRSTDQVLVHYPASGWARRVAVVKLVWGTDVNRKETVRRAAAAASHLALDRHIARVAVRLPEIDMPARDLAQAVVEGFRLGAYRFTRHRSEPVGFDGPKELTLLVSRDARADVDEGAARGVIMSDSTCLARDLANWSPGEMTAVMLSEKAVEVAESAGLSARVMDKAAIEEEGMGGLLAVNRGSQGPPTFTILEWKPDGLRTEQPIVLAGKGIVFDTGGLSLKPTKDAMDRMKFDMAGAAAVIGAMDAVARMHVPVHVVGLVPATDNRPGENAYVPGEVVRMHSGLTVEVLNTDAEGRMILADALSYARRFEPGLVVDVATLTGAQVVALGNLAAAYLSNALGDAGQRWSLFQEAGYESGDLVAALPMFSEYADLLKSDTADIKNVGGRQAGCITAAKFLERFVSYPWVHLDIAGPSYLDKRSGYRPQGGTGFGVRLLADVIDRWGAQ